MIVYSLHAQLNKTKPKDVIDLKLNENLSYLAFQIMENRTWINFHLSSYKAAFEAKIEGNSQEEFNMSKHIY